MGHKIHLSIMIFSVWIFSYLIIHAQNPLLNNISYHELATQDLLPTSNTGIIMQDNVGFFWYGTNGEGLCRDDGYRIKVYSSKTSGRGIMKSDEISCLHEDRNGQIWFGTRSGLYVLNKKTEKIKKVDYELFNRKKVNCIATNSQNEILVGVAQNLIKFNLDGELIKEYNVCKNRRQEVKELMIDSKGTLWMTILRGGIYSMDKNSDQVIERPWDYNFAASFIVEDPSKKHYWIGTWGGGIVKYSKNGKIIPQPASSSMTKFGLEINNMHIDTIHNIMWVSTMDDLYAYLMRNDSLIALETSSFLPKDKKLIGKVIQDNNSNMWIPGFSPHTFCLAWTQGSIRRDGVTAMKNKMGYKIMVDKIVREGDYYWIYQRRTRLSLYNSKTGEMTFMATDALPTPLATQKVLAKCQDKKGVWSCDGKHLIHIWNEGMKIFWEEDSSGCTPNYIAALNDIGKGQLLIGTEKQAFKYDYHAKKLKQLTDSVGTIHRITWSKDGLAFSTDPTVLPTLTDKRGHIWTLTENTLTETNPKTGASRSINANDKCVNVDYFTDMTIYGDSICLGGVGAFCMVAPCKELDVDHNDDIIILVDSIYLSSFNHLHADKIQFTYRFVPESFVIFGNYNKWIKLESGKNIISYDKLWPGTYTLEAKCTDEYGRWSDVQQLKTFTIATPIYMKWYMSVLYFLIAQTCIFVIYRFIKNRYSASQSADTSEIFENAITEDSKTPNNEPSRIDKEAQLFMEQVIGLVEKNIDNANYDNIQLAKDMNLSRSNLYRRFQKYASVSSPSEFIRYTRLEKGKQLLKETSLSITEISYKVGFSSSQYFAKCFKDQYGMTPKEYRASQN
ncbi:MAG: helix-turn-helix domain-containing protein [Bacteroidaceae bacterium]|nr:helix-turn-helix domain-containing protein [Bacteroidaceae bacterium]